MSGQLSGDRQDTISHKLYYFPLATRFCPRATHNLWTLLEEASLIDEHLKAGTYRNWYEQHLDNSIYRPLITKLLEMLDNRPGT